MPLGQRLRTEFGTDNNYWRIQRVLLNLEEATSTVHIEGWLDEATWRAGSMPQSSRVFVFSDLEADPFLNPAEGISMEQIAVRAIQGTTDFIGGQPLA